MKATEHYSRRPVATLQVQRKKAWQDRCLRLLEKAAILLAVLLILRRILNAGGGL